MAGSFTIASRLAAPIGVVWSRVLTMAGVNAELGPWLHMTTPRRYAGLSLAEAPTGSVLFASWILFLGVVPYDRHALCLDRVSAVDADATAGEAGFDERSSSFTQRVWRHERTLRALDPHTTELEDRLTFTPRAPGLTPLITGLVAAVFRHRHARLRATFAG